MLCRRFYCGLPSVLPQLAVILAFCTSLGAADELRMKAVVPDENAQAEKVALINEIYQHDYESAETREQKLRFARKLYHVGLETKNDPTGRFVLLRIARDIAIEQRDPNTTIRAIDAMDETFQIDALQMKVASLTSIASAARMRSEQKEVAAELISLIDQCVKSDRYAIAEPLPAIAISAALKARDTPLRVAAIAREDELVRLTGDYNRIANSLETLAVNSDAPEANLAVGKFYCFSKGDWARGLPMLAVGTDQVLKSLSLQEMAQPADAMSIGEGWWEFAESTSEWEKKHIRKHAAMWYAKALPDLSGLNKARIQRRIQEAGLQRNDGTANAHSAPQFALALDGKTSYVSVNTLRYDGRYPITVEAIVRVDVPPKTTGVICGTYDDAGLGLAILKNGLWEFAVRSRSAGYRLSQSDQSATLGKWTHVAGVYDMSQCYLCVDGKIQPSVQPVPGGHKASKIPIQLGINPGRVRVDFFHGEIRELRISKVARYTAPFKAAQEFDADDDTILLLKLNEGSGVVAKDFSGNQHHGAIVNGNWIPLN